MCSGAPTGTHKIRITSDLDIVWYMLCASARKSAYKSKKYVSRLRTVFFIFIFSQNAVRRRAFNGVVYMT